MKAFSLAALLLLLIIQSPEAAQDKAARDRLKKMNIAFTTDGFIQSIIEGDKAKVELFLAAGMSPNTALGRKQLEVGNRVFLKGQTALMLALCYEYNDIASTLLANGADVNQKGQNETFPLQLAKGAMVKELIERGADVNQKGSYGQTAVMWAAGDGDLEKLALLLDGADINAKDQGGFTALRVAARARRLQVVQLLIGHGADLSGFSERAIRLMTSDSQHDDRVNQILDRVRPIENGLSRTGPSLEVQREVPARLLEVASESAEARAEVIERLLDVVEDPAAQDESPIAYAWMTAVKVLGKLRATEALDVLVDNLDRTGQNGLILSIHIQPVYSALVSIGEPAVPKLIEALSHSKRANRMEAAWVLFSINKDEAKTALELSCQTEKDEEVKQAFKSVIERIEQGH